MKKDKYKPTAYGSGSYNIRYCPKCEKYQHFRRCYNDKHGLYDYCSICKYQKDIK